MPIQGHKNRISIIIKSSEIIDGKEARKVSFSIKLVSRSFKVNQGQKLPIKGQKGQFFILKSGVRLSKFLASGWEKTGALVKLYPRAKRQVKRILVTLSHRAKREDK